ncbi:MAG TPA: extracellular solute-binding protein [Blastocatellia bacterium]|nr:extracellular solute-binding protein [Blastocatellia bacterium]
MRFPSSRSKLLILCLLLISSVIGGTYVALIKWAPGVAAGRASLGRTGVAAAQDDCSDGINVPNRYNRPFCVRPDELFIFAVNYRPFEFGGETPERNAGRFFETVIGARLRETFPNMKIKYATWDYPVRYEDLVTAGVVPDIILENPHNRIDRDLEPRGWVADMTPMIAASGIDLSQLNRGAVEMVRSRSDGGMYGVPIFIDEFMLFYNKKIFDKFHVSYPTVGMTYDEAYCLAAKLTRQSGLDAYKGYLQHPDSYLTFNQLGLYPFQPTTSEEPPAADIIVDITTPAWRDLAENIDRFLQIPRNTFTTVDDYLKGDMSRPGHVAMAVNTLSKLPMYAGNDLFVDPLNRAQVLGWLPSIELGITSVPVLRQGSKTIYQPNMLAAFIPPQSNKKDQAIAVVKWMVSEPAQIELSRHAIKGVLQTPAVISSFGAAIPELAGIDTSAVYWGRNAVVKNYHNTEYWDIPLFSAFRQHVLRDGMTPQSSLIVTEQEDIPTYIRNRAAAGQTW